MHYICPEVGLIVHRSMSIDPLIYKLQSRQFECHQAEVAPLQAWRAKAFAVTRMQSCCSWIWRHALARGCAPKCDHCP